MIDVRVQNFERSLRTQVQPLLCHSWSATLRWSKTLLLSYVHLRVIGYARSNPMACDLRYSIHGPISSTAGSVTDSNVHSQPDSAEQLPTNPLTRIISSVAPKHSACPALRTIQPSKIIWARFWKVFFNSTIGHCQRHSPSGSKNTQAQPEGDQCNDCAGVDVVFDVKGTVLLIMIRHTIGLRYLVPSPLCMHLLFFCLN
jgi:hypothetical protein